MFFGLTNLPATSQMMINHWFHAEIHDGNISIYMDDIAIHIKPKPGKSEEEHLAQH